jgi:hypothetical protein
VDIGLIVGAAAENRPAPEGTTGELTRLDGAIVGASKLSNVRALEEGCPRTRFSDDEQELHVIASSTFSVWQTGHSIGDRPKSLSRMSQKAS